MLRDTKNCIVRLIVILRNIVLICREAIISLYGIKLSTSGGTEVTVDGFVASDGTAKVATLNLTLFRHWCIRT